MELVIDKVRVTYGATTAVAGVSLTLGPGVHALLGPNGAGKSSLLETIATLRKPASGTIRFGDATGNALRPHLGYLPQDNLPRSRFTVREHLTYICWLREIPESRSPAEVERVMELCTLGGYADRPIAALSGGLRRRVGLASSLVGEPSLVLLDEASAGLDMEQRDTLQKIIAAISRTATVITSTHIVEDIVHISDTITVMRAGRFVAHSPAAEFCQPRTLDAMKEHYLRLVHS